MPEKRPLTTRRGFIAAFSFGGVSLYALWAGYGAAPTGLGGDGDHDAAPTPEAAGDHGGHGAAAGPTIDEFRAASENWAERHRLPDGSVRPGRFEPPASLAVQDQSGMDHGAGHAEAATPTVAPVDVYLAAYQWGFDPDVLRLDAGRPYRFRMMALDASHGASIHLGPGSRINRLRPGQLAEQVMTFTEPGEYLVYCTIYCGIGHDRMFGKIVVS